MEYWYTGFAVWLLGVADHLSDADVVVFYSLNDLLAKIVNRLPERVALTWRFFGYEMYDRMPEFIYTDTTRSVLANAGRIACMKRWLKGQWSIKGGIKRICSLGQTVFPGSA